jgi:hypothetical protein
MQNAVFKTFPDAHSEYKFTNRAPDMLFSRKCYDWVKEQVQGGSLFFRQPCFADIPHQRYQIFD